MGLQMGKCPSCDMKLPDNEYQYESLAEMYSDNPKTFYMSEVDYWYCPDQACSEDYSTFWHKEEVLWWSSSDEAIIPLESHLWLCCNSFSQSCNCEIPISWKEAISTATKKLGGLKNFYLLEEKTGLDCRSCYWYGIEACGPLLKALGKYNNDPKASIELITPCREYEMDTAVVRNMPLGASTGDLIESKYNLKEKRKR